MQVPQQMRIAELLTELESVTWFVIPFFYSRPVLGADGHLHGGL